MKVTFSVVFPLEFKMEINPKDDAETIASQVKVRASTLVGSVKPQIEDYWCPKSTAKLRDTLGQVLRMEFDND